jgi:hypothetical protein
MGHQTKLMIQATGCGTKLVGEVTDAQWDSRQIVRLCWRTLDRVADMFGCIYSHKFSPWLWTTLFATCNDLYIESGARLGCIWHAWRLRLGMGYAAWLGSGARTTGPSSASHYSDFLPSFLYFMMNAHSMPGGIRWSIIYET